MGTQSRTGLETRGWPQSSIGGVDLGGAAFTTGLLYRALAVTDSREAMDLSVSLATEILPGCDAAGVCVVHSGDRIDTHAASTDALREVDALQHRLAEGPCVDALQHHDTVRSNDLSSDERWPHWGPQVARRQGYLSMVSYRVFSIGGDLGVLSLYGTSRAAFTIDDVHDGLALAAHVGAALAVELEVEHLEAALRSRTVIGQATGILMERFGMAPDHAFSVLSRLSQHTNVKLRHLAEQIVRTRTLPQA